MLRNLMKTALWGLLGAAVVPFIGYLIAAPLIAILDPHCGAPGYPGACRVDLVDLMKALVVPGAVLFVLTGLLRTVLHRPPRPRGVARGLMQRLRRNPAGR